MSKQPAMPNIYATCLSGQGKPLRGSKEHFVFGNPGVRVCEHETSSSTNMVWPGPRQPAFPLARPTFEFRLSGSETQEQSVAAPGPGGRERRGRGQQRAGVPERQRRCRRVTQRQRKRH